MSVHVSKDLVEYRQVFPIGTRVIRVDLSLPEPRVSAHYGDTRFGKTMPCSLFLNEILAVVEDAKKRKEAQDVTPNPVDRLDGGPKGSLPLDLGK